MGMKVWESQKPARASSVLGDHSPESLAGLWEPSVTPFLRPKVS